ncbi:MAG TPA: FlgD immunoglobulin-like domain containing protein [Candidatus Krumholzibacteria bacterium]|nr:FlgD immunoglobulin-like domain containing protein [Candidatus Krumholzibacteria bacterium]HPD73051.1 FlgD immunoglobulin-like domain containing protein [Candidatus Krumholzibacteria bacterium]HRY41851.1 FlgD immunoglobulin-like domain containing protein [Candidatus Krumholzibacteria bacterium]
MPRLRSFAHAWLLVACLALPALAPATTIHVPGDAATIAAGIGQAAPGDTVVVAAGTYLEHDIAIASDIVVIGDASNPSAVVIDAQQLGRIFTGDGADTISLAGLTLTGGSHASGGGALRCDDAKLVSLADCVLADNSSPLYGGGLYFRSTVSGNQLRLARCTFTGNHAIGWDGAAVNIRCGGVGGVEITECRFAGNVADYWGGAIEFGDCTATVTGTMFLDNTAHQLGGAIFAQDCAIDLIGCTFAGNGADSGGGAVFVDSGTVTATGCTFTGNRAAVSGGGFYLNSGAGLVLDHSILVFSQLGAAAAGPGVAAGSCNDVFANVGGDYVGPLAPLSGIDGNLAANPLFCDDLAPETPYSLDVTSPCAAENNPGCGLIGAWPVGCSGTGTGAGGAVPAAFSLAPCRPNPFNPRTWISFTLDRAQAVTVTVRDLRGGLVRVLADGWKPAGSQTIAWDGRDVRGQPAPAATYLVRVEAGGRALTQKATLVK